MTIHEKVVELLHAFVFSGKLIPGDCDFFSTFDESGQSYVGFGSLIMHNEEVWGYRLGKKIKNGSKVYCSSDFNYCRDFANSIITDIELQLYNTEAMEQYKNVQNYLYHLYKKIMLAQKINSEKMGEFSNPICHKVGLEFVVNGEMGEESIGTTIDEDGPLFAVDNFEWVDDVKIEDKEGNCFYDRDEVDDIIGRFKDNEDIIKVVSLFRRHTRARMNVERLGDGVYNISFTHWDIWRDNKNSWMEAIGQIKKQVGSYTSSTYLEISGTYDELDTMINLVRGDR